MKEFLLVCSFIVSISLHAGLFLYPSFKPNQQKVIPYIKLNADRIDVKIITTERHVNKHVDRDMINAPSRVKADVIKADDQIISRAKHLGKLAIKYPRVSKILGEEGVVKLSVVVDSVGAVKEVLIVESSGFERLDEYALKEVSASRFSPASRVDDKGNVDFISDKVDLSIRFKLF